MRASTRAAKRRSRRLHNQRMAGLHGWESAPALQIDRPSDFFQDLIQAVRKVVVSPVVRLTCAG